ncbi:hypothetical protein GCM10011380_31010 [Sphingomonas metalli]|uniref:Lipoprotein n=1 Tax=Sphingomonas metalli TaxID=1779358 RepID=A0A916WY05_9SPHN|nr:hypothetical protein [Sphingomonas metalli]GGB39321.1 hypothetical protein GCM10011380_31010 [Sphingomonas metalli]
MIRARLVLMGVMITGMAGLGACHRTPDREEEARAVAASGFVPPVTQAPDPMPGQRNATPLSAYAGRYPRDAVDGVTFYDRTEVANALIDLVPEEKIRREMTGREATQAPIFARGDRVAAHGCAPHDCDGRNWTLLVAVDGDAEKARMCLHDAATMQDRSRWTSRRETRMRPGGCPQGQES